MIGLAIFHINVYILYIVRQTARHKEIKRTNRGSLYAERKKENPIDRYEDGDRDRDRHAKR